MNFVLLPNKTINVKIIKAIGLKIDGKSANKINPYVTITLEQDESQIKKTRTIMSNPNPIWNETFTFQSTKGQNAIFYFDIKSEGTGFIDKIISKKNKLSLDSINLSKPLTIRLQDFYGIGNVGKLYVQISFGKISQKEKPNLKTISSQAQNFDDEEEDIEYLSSKKLKKSAKMKSSKQSPKDQEQQIQNFDSEIKAQNEKIQNYESEIHNYQSIIQNYESEIKHYQSQEQNFESEIREQNSKIQNFESEIQNYQSKEQDYQLKIQSYELQTKEQNSKIQDYKSQIETHQSKEQDYKTKIDTYESVFLPGIRSQPPENYFIDDKTFNLYFEDQGKIGEGATSTTHKVVDKRTKTPFCKKILKVKDGNTINDAKKAINEFEVLHTINHPCICKSFYINTSETVQAPNRRTKNEITTISLYLEYLEYSLGNILNLGICDTTKGKIVLEITHAMNHIHKKGFIHRDLKIENIMLNSSFNAKLVDFGLVAIDESVLNGYSFVKDSLTRGIGTLMFMSPEMINEEKYDNKTDVYSFGVLLHCIFFGQNPQQNMQDKTSRKKIEIPLSLSHYVSKFCFDLINKCLSPLPLDRPSFQEILDEMRNNYFQFTEDVDPSVLIQRDKEIELFESIK